MKLTYPAIFYPCDDGPGYAVEVPDLPGCATGGATLAEAVEMGIDAASGWVLGELEDGKPVPEASAVRGIHPDPAAAGAFVSVLFLDMDAYAEKYGSKTVRKNLSIPAWLDAYAEKRNVNFSRVLQDSLMRLYDQERTGA